MNSLQFCSAFLLPFLLIGFTGCAPTQQWLQPRVCECESADADDSNSSQIAHAIAFHQVDQAHYRAETDGDEAALAIKEAQAAEEEEEDEEVWYRSADDLAYEPIDPTISDTVIALASDEDREQFEDRYNIDAPEPGEAFRGRFRAQDRSTIAVHRPGEALEIYSDGELIASQNLEQFDRVIADDDITRFPTGALDLIRGSDVQLKLVHAEAHEDGSVTYHLGIYQLIGEYIGTAFRQPIARADKDGTVRRLADLRFLHGYDSRIIEWIPLDENGDPVDEPLQYKWNHWEGVYRLPGPPPTAPDDPQS